MKSFRFYLFYRPEPPKKKVEDYTPEELEGFCRDLERTQMRFKKMTRNAFVVYVVAVVAIAGGWVATADRDFEWFMAFWFFTLALCAAVAIIGPVNCPACGNELEAGLGAYCPECGGKTVEKPGLLETRQCTACDKSLIRGKGRNYEILVCPICGVPLTPGLIRSDGQPE
jgi:predicted RNA-binding Zn-ribbon protein involved in translation (DUF1610 family)